MITSDEMSAYENVVTGKLKLKGKALDVKAAGGIGVSKKKKKHHKINHNARPSDSPIVGNRLALTDQSDGGGRAEAATRDDYLTPIERRYLERWGQIERQRLAKSASKSHRYRIQEFNEHYDIPKVGPG